MSSHFNHNNFKSIFLNYLVRIGEGSRKISRSKKLSFPLLQPSFLPDNFSLDIVRVYQESGQYNNVYLEYANDAGEIFKVSELFIGDAEVRRELANDAGIIKEIIIGTDPAVLVLMPSDLSYLEWIKGNVKVLISGKLSEQDIIRVADSLH
ncbi:DUF4367 domain-containing protein [Paenibacillus jiagnxiensis]|uniref:DUF4367 domain-containing protein n=1 Tax=Paenibacillus jiagnxiensis TaxID=3228926 RepID=UPI0034808639